MAKRKPIYGPHIMYVAVENYGDSHTSIQVVSPDPSWFQPDAMMLESRLMTPAELIDYKLDETAWNYLD